MKSQLLDHQVAVILFKREARDGRQAAKAYASKYFAKIEEST